MKFRSIASSVTIISLASAIVIPTIAVSSAQAASSSKASTAKSAAALGGLKGLTAACKKEGKLNVIALPPDWANYGKIIAGFKAKYKIKIDSANPDGNSQDEINAANQLRGTKRAPDVFDIGQAVANNNLNAFAQYKVATWAQIPAVFKDVNGTWVNDYGGYMSVGYDANKVPAPTSLDDLLRPEYKGKVALNGDPTKAAAGMNGVFMASIANGGSVDDISKGVEFFKKLHDVGNFLPVDPTPATIASGQTPVVFDWDYLQAGQVAGLKAKGIDWKIFIPKGAVVGGYYIQAINQNAPHPACARLWEEYLYSPAGQNEWLRGGARPVMADALVKAGTIDKAAFARLPKVQGKPAIASVAQTKKANDYLVANWAAAIGSK